MAKHPAAEAPRMTTDLDGTRRIETEEERIKRVTTTTRIQASMERIEAAAAKDRNEADFRPGDVVTFTHEGEAAPATVLGRYDASAYLVETRDKTRWHAAPAELTMIHKGNGHPQTREQAAMDFASAIIEQKQGKLIFTATPEGRAAQQRDWRDDAEQMYQTATAGLPVAIQRLHSDARTPTQARAGDAGYDLHSIEDTLVYRGSRKLIGTGIAVAIPEGYVGLIMPRSGLANKHGIDILGGVIDAGYRGEVKVILQSHSGSASFEVKVGDRIAQLVIQPVKAVNFIETDTLPDSERAADGFGSTGA